MENSVGYFYRVKNDTENDMISICDNSDNMCIIVKSCYDLIEREASIDLDRTEMKKLYEYLKSIFEG